MAAALCLTTTAGAAGTKVYTLGTGDLALVKGTQIVCGVGEHKGMACFLANESGPVRKSYDVTVKDTFANIGYTSATGRVKVVIQREQPSGKSARAPVTAFAPGGKVVQVSAGDQLKVSGARVWCSINRGRVVSASCFKLTSGLKPIVGSYAVVIDEKHAALLKVTSSKGSGKFKVVLLRKQP